MLRRRPAVAILFESDLFVFASHVEYSPLVLFESAAAGLPFISVPVGNAEEISQWTQCGVICPAKKGRNRNTKVSIPVLADEMLCLSMDPDKIQELGECGRRQWEIKYAWDKIVDQYEEIITGKTEN